MGAQTLVILDLIRWTGTDFFFDETGTEFVGYINEFITHLQVKHKKESHRGVKGFR